MGERAKEKLEHDDWLDIGRRSASAYAAHAEWLFRRVETIEFAGSGSVKRNISVDFEVPSGLPKLGKLAAQGTKLVPISVYHKWPPLMDFNFVGPDGRPTSLYLRATNRRLDFGLLLGMADVAMALDEFDGRPKSREELQDKASEIAASRCGVLAPGLQSQLKEVVGHRRPQWAAVEQVTKALRAELNSKLDRALRNERTDVAAQIAATVDLAGRLASSSILWVAVDGRAGTDRIVKFSYFDHSDATEAWGKRLSMACSWRQRNLSIYLPHAGRNVIFHLDIRAPQGCIKIAAIKALALPPAKAEDGLQGGAEIMSVADLAEKYAEIKLPDEWVGPASSRFYLDYGKPIVLASTSGSPDHGEGQSQGSGQEASAEIVDGRAHVYLGPTSAPSHRVFVQVKLAARRSGFIAGCAGAGIGVALLMLATYLNLTSAAINIEPTAVLLSVVPVVLGYVLVRPAEDALESYHLAGVRWMALLSGATPIAGALTLVLTHPHAVGAPPDLSTARPIWRDLLILSWIMALALLGSFLRASNPQES